MTYTADTLYRLRPRRPSHRGRLSALCVGCGVKFIPGDGRPMPTDCTTCGRSYAFTDTDRAAVETYNASLEEGS